MGVVVKYNQAAILIMDFQTAPMMCNVLNLRWVKP